jgi:hypothetical protein
MQKLSHEDLCHKCLDGCHNRYDSCLCHQLSTMRGPSIVVESGLDM